MPAKLRAVALKHCELQYMSLIDVLEGTKTQGVVAVRRAIIREFRSMGMSLPRIGSYLGLHNTTVLYHLREAPNKIVGELYISNSPACPDLSGEWAI